MSAIDTIKSALAWRGPTGRTMGHVVLTRDEAEEILALLDGAGMAETMSEPAAGDDGTMPELGPCCGCGTTEGVRNMCMVSRRAPVPGTGWGCVVCDLPGDGAIAVFCDACVEKPVTHVCVGYPKDGKRRPIEELAPGVFDHDAAKHAADDMARTS